MRKLITLFAIFLWVSKIQAQTPTWNQDIAAIFYKNCTTCHHQGGIGPTSFMTYTATYNQRYLANHYVQIKEMPPWPPDPAYKRLAHERVLSDADVAKINAWVLGGAPVGTGTAPVAPVYNNQTQLSSVSFSTVMPTYTVNAPSGDLYRCFVMPTGLASYSMANEIEIIPGDPSIVHHVLVFEDTTSKPLDLNYSDGNPGYTSFFGTKSDDSKLVGEWVPGTAPLKFPNNMGVKLRKNTNLIFQIHYPKGTYNKVDSTRINFKFGPQTARSLTLAPVLSESNFPSGSKLFIPPNSTASYTISTYTPLVPFTVIGCSPHMHLLGTKIKSYFIDPNSNDTVPLIRINKWDFKWQGVYMFRKPVIVPGVSLAYAEASYDNTSANPYSVKDSVVFAGENTDDEMLQVFFAFTFYQNGDENIVIDTTPLVEVAVEELQNDIVKTLQFYAPYPNPATESINLQCYSVKQDKARIEIYNIEGKEIDRFEKQLEPGHNYFEYNVRRLAEGTYIIKMSSSTGTREKKFIKTQ